LATLERRIANSQKELETAERELAECRKAAARTEPELAPLRRRLADISKRTGELQHLRQPKPGVWGKLFGQVEQPAEVTAELDRLGREWSSLMHRQSQIEQLEFPVRGLQRRITLAQAEMRKLEEAAAPKRRRSDSLEQLRAAAAANASETRKLAATVKRKLDQQPWCPYCGGSLGVDPHADHIYPVAKGGRSVLANMVYACAGCNSKKTNLTLTTFIRKFTLDRAAIESRLQLLGKDF